MPTITKKLEFTDSKGNIILATMVTDTSINTVQDSPERAARPVYAVFRDFPSGEELGTWISVITDEPEYILLPIGVIEPIEPSNDKSYITGIGYGWHPDEAEAAAIKDFTNKIN